MKSHLLVAAAAYLLLVRAGSAAAEVNDLADLVPAHSLAYLELHDPPRLARELHALVEGSYLQHPASFFAHHGKKRGKSNEDAFILAWLGSPEFIDELGDWQGGCMALTGFTKNDYPEITGVLRTGKSRMLPLGLRMALAASGEVRASAASRACPSFRSAMPKMSAEMARRTANPPSRSRLSALAALPSLIGSP